jgi:hypothetical protein
VAFLCRIGEAGCDIVIPVVVLPPNSRLREEAITEEHMTGLIVQVNNYRVPFTTAQMAAIATGLGDAVSRLLSAECCTDM